MNSAPSNDKYNLSGAVGQVFLVQVYREHSLEMKVTWVLLRIFLCDILPLSCPQKLVVENGGGLAGL